MQSQAETLAEGLAEAWSSGDAEKIASFFTEDCVFEDVCNGEVCYGHEELKARAKAVFKADPDLKLKIESLFATEDWIGCEWTETGTRKGKKFSMRGASIVELQRGKISREAVYCHFDGAVWVDT